MPQGWVRSRDDRHALKPLTWDGFEMTAPSGARPGESVGCPHSPRHMRLNPAVFDVGALRRSSNGVEYLVLQSSESKAQRWFNGGRFWQVPSGVFRDGDAVPDALERALLAYELTARTIWAAEHTYTIYNRRFDEMQIIGVYAVEVDGGDPRLDPAEHSAFRWLPFDTALDAVHYRGLKDGLRSVREYITGPSRPAPELCLRAARLTPQ